MDVYMQTTLGGKHYRRHEKVETTILTMIFLNLFTFRQIHQDSRKARAICF
jgi:hypothetical protein